MGVASMSRALVPGCGDDGHTGARLDQGFAGHERDQKPGEGCGQGFMLDDAFAGLEFYGLLW